MRKARARRAWVPWGRSVVFDLCLRRLEVHGAGVAIDLHQARAAVNAAASSTSIEQLRAALIDEAVAALACAEQLPPGALIVNDC